MPIAQATSMVGPTYKRLLLLMVTIPGGCSCRPSWCLSWHARGVARPAGYASVLSCLRSATRFYRLRCGRRTHAGVVETSMMTFHLAILQPSKSSTKATCRHMPSGALSQSSDSSTPPSDSFVATCMPKVEHSFMFNDGMQQQPGRIKNFQVYSRPAIKVVRTDLFQLRDSHLRPTHARWHRHQSDHF